MITESELSSKALAEIHSRVSVHIALSLSAGCDIDTVFESACHIWEQDWRGQDPVIDPPTELENSLAAAIGFTILDSSFSPSKELVALLTPEENC